MDQWSYEPAPDLEQTIAQRLRSFPRYPDMMIYTTRSILHVVLRLFLKLYHRLEITGRENLPAGESFVMIGNHASHLDALCLTSSVPLKRLHRTFPAAAADYFFSSLSRSVVATIFVNGLPFDRFGKGAESLEMCRQLLARPGNILILFPEGTRSTDGQIQRFKSGIGRLVAGTPVPGVPCDREGAGAAWPKGKGFPRPRKLTLEIGTPKSFPDRSPEDREQVEAMCDELRRDVIALSAPSNSTL
ncbi:MAG: lysophospholipid acyltransferase family protein [Gammaproteobacteria bacterium]|nr:lysophospholipid acyltransferase family protein [Gammaproteobacteria bacterium]